MKRLEKKIGEAKIGLTKAEYRALARAMKFEGTVSSLEDHLLRWVKEMNRRGWKQKRLTKRWMRPAFAKVFVSCAYTMLMVDHGKEETLQFLSGLVNQESRYWK